MSAKLLVALLAALTLAPRASLAETWRAAEVAEAEKLRAAEAARAAAYRERVARGDVRSASAPMPREAPQRPDDSAGDALRDAADIADWIERLLGRVEEEAARDEQREELRRRERERRQRGSP